MITDKLHIICEKDVGMFSLVQQVISHIPEALYNKRTPVVFFRDKCCYWISDGYQNRNTVWEYYFEPLVAEITADHIPKDIRNYIESHLYPIILEIMLVYQIA